MPIEPLLSPEAFTELEGVTHLYSRGESPWLKSHDEVYAKFAHLKSAGPLGGEGVSAFAEECREKMGQLWGIAPGRIVWMPSAAEAMNWLARGLDCATACRLVTSGDT